MLSYSISRSQIHFKGPLSRLRRLVTTESPFVMVKNDFYFMLNARFVLEIFTFSSLLSGYVEKRLDIVNFKI